MGSRGGPAFVRAIEHITDLVGDWLAPPACAACDVPLLKRAAVFCAACAATVERAAGGTPFGPFAFGGALKAAIVRLKYESRSDLGRPLGRLLSAAVTEAGLSADRVVPVPLHPTRLAERGYNQAALLARHLTVAPLSTALRRVAVRQRQAALARSDRLSNLDGAFVADASVRGRVVMVVDDVSTTGATLAACEAALIAAGARRVVPVALCRAR